MDEDHIITEGLHQRKGKQISERSQFVKDAVVKAASYCAYQERTQQEVRDKLYDLGLHQDEVEESLSDLITQGFVNEERFAKAYVRGKFYHNKWGRIKIVHGLQAKGISDYCQKAGLSEIEDSDYRQQLEAIISKKMNDTTGLDAWKKKNKVARYAIGKGYEAELVWNTINEMEDL